MTNVKMRLSCVDYYSEGEREREGLIYPSPEGRQKFRRKVSKTWAHSVHAHCMCRRQLAHSVHTNGSSLIFGWYFLCSGSSHNHQQCQVLCLIHNRIPMKTTTLTPRLIIILLFWHFVRHCFWRQTACIWKTMHGWLL